MDKARKSSRIERYISGGIEKKPLFLVSDCLGEDACKSADTDWNQSIEPEGWPWKFPLQLLLLDTLH